MIINQTIITSRLGDIRASTAADFPIPGFVSGLVGMFYWPALIMVFWNWFAVPLGAPMIGYAHAFGLGLLTDAFLGVRGGRGDAFGRSQDKNLPMTAFAFHVFAPTALFIIGLIARSSM